MYEGDYYVDETSTASSCDDPSIGVADDGRLDGPADDTDVWSAYRATWQAVHELPTATTPEEFALKWAADGQPVVVRGGAVGWPALKLWTLPLLRERFGAEVSNREPAAGEVMFDADGIPIDLFNDHDVEDEGLHWEYVTSTASRLLIPFFCSSLFLSLFFFSFLFPSSFSQKIAYCWPHDSGNSTRDAPQFSWLVRNKTISKVLQQEYGRVPFLAATIARGPEYLFMSQGQLQGTPRLAFDNIPLSLAY